jgi:hypothetical protein
MSELPMAPRPRCMHLSCKAMSVYGEAFESDPDYQAGMTDFWCAQTQKSWGPDDDGVSLEMCSNPERACFQEF